MALWRCMNPDCADRPGVKNGHDFEGDRSVCPKCGADRAHPRLGVLIIRLATVHFDPPTKFAGVGENVRACDGKSVLIDDPGKLALEHIHAATGDPGSVNCPACKKTDKFKAAMAAATAEG